MTDSINKLQPPPDQDQRDAALDITKSFIVQAPAGSGKTTLLVKRYLKLLTVVREPEEILAITFTRKAAKEMRTRILRAIRDVDDELAAQVLQRDKALNWQLTINPHRMRIQTIDSFVRRVVAQLPCQSQLSLVYETTDNAGVLYEEAASRTLDLIADETSPFGDDIAKALALSDNDYVTLHKLLTQMLGTREHWLEFLMEIVGDDLSEHDTDGFQHQLIDARTAYVASLIDNLRKTIGIELWNRLTTIVTASQRSRGRVIDGEIDLSDPEEITFLVQTFLTQQSDPRKQVTSREGFPRLDKLRKERWQKCRNELFNRITPESLALLRNMPTTDLAEQIQDNISCYATVLIAAANELHRVFEESKEIDFTEISIAARRALRVDGAPTDLALALDYKIKHIMVDEYQDTSASQDDLLALLMDGWEPDDGNTFFAVGDPMQSIYAFRNANVGNFLRAEQSGLANRKLTKLQLTTNFRSTKGLVELCNRIFKTVLGDTSDPIFGRVEFAESDTTDNETDTNAGFTICISDSDQHEAELVANKVLELTKSSKSHEKIAILVRTRSGLEPLFLALRREGLRWKGVEIQSLSDLPVVRDLYSLTRALLNKSDRQSWAEVLMSPLVGLDMADIELLSELERGFEMVLKTSSVSTQGGQILDRVSDHLTEALLSQHRSVRSRIERLWYQLGGPGAYPSLDDPKSETLIANARHYFDVLEQFTEATFDADLVWSTVTGMYATEINDNADVEIMTVHKAKGLEFDHVILPNLNRTTRRNLKELAYFSRFGDRVVVAVHSPEEADPLHDLAYTTRTAVLNNEIPRLLYVAATRAKRSLWLYGTVKNNKTREGIPRPAKSSFLGLLHEIGKLPPGRVPGTEDLLTNVVVRSEVEWTYDFDEQDRDDASERFQVWRRVDPDWQFVPPTDMPVLPTGLEIDQREIIQDPSSLRLSQSVTDANPVRNRRFRDFSELVSLQIGLSESMVIGQLVHGEMQRMVEMRDMSLPDVARVEMWRNQLRSKGYSTNQTSNILEAVQQQVKYSTENEHGRWLLNPDHDQSEVEASYTFVIDDSKHTVIVDRTFIEDKTRWIVDYKSSTIPDDSGSSLEVKVLRYQWQLFVYADVLAEIDDTPIRAGIYFTDAAEFVEVDVSTEARAALEGANEGLATTWENYRRLRE